MLEEKMFTEDGEDITPKYYWDDKPYEQGKCYSKVIGQVTNDGVFEINDTAKTRALLQKEREDAFFVPEKKADSDVHKKEAVNHPDHYNFGKYETIDIIRDSMTEEQFIGFCLGNAIKYISRCQHKGKMVEDIRKAIWYLNEIVEN